MMVIARQALAICATLLVAGAHATRPLEQLAQQPRPGEHGAVCRHHHATRTNACNAGLSCVYTLIGDAVVRSSCDRLSGPGEPCTLGSQGSSGIACYPGLHCAVSGQSLGAPGQCTDAEAEDRFHPNAGEHGRPCRGGDRGACDDGLTCVTTADDNGASESLCLNMAGPGEACTASVGGPRSGILCFPGLTCTQHNALHGEAGVCTDQPLDDGAPTERGARPMIQEAVVVPHGDAPAPRRKRRRRGDQPRA